MSFCFFSLSVRRASAGGDAKKPAKKKIKTLEKSLPHIKCGAGFFSKVRLPEKVRSVLDENLLQSIPA
jgi:hypothetical protein